MFMYSIRLDRETMNFSFNHPEDSPAHFQNLEPIFFQHNSPQAWNRYTVSISTSARLEIVWRAKSGSICQGFLQYSVKSSLWIQNR